MPSATADEASKLFGCGEKRPPITGMNTQIAIRE